MILTRRNRRPPRRDRRRTAQTVVGTHLAVITAIANNGQTLNFQHEVDLVKASVLYADDVEILSLGSQMIRQMNEFAAGDSMNLWGLLAGLDDDTLRYLNPDLDPEQLRQLIPLLELDPNALRAVSATVPDMGPLSEFANVLDQARDTADSSMEEMRAMFQQMRVDSGLVELEPAVRKQLVRFNENIALGDEMDTVIGTFIKQLKRYLLDPKWFVLVDEDIASLARALINEGHLKPPQRSISNAGEAALGTGLVSRLPAFTGPPMDELLDLRRDLGEPLGRYRRKVSHIRSELRSEPFDEHIEAEIDAVCRTEVEPAIGEIRQAMADHGLVKEQLKAFAGDLGDFVKGRSIPTGLTIFSANVLDIGDVLAMGLNAAGAGMAVAPAVAKGLLARADGRAKAKSHDLYYLYEVNRRLK